MELCAEALTQSLILVEGCCVPAAVSSKHSEAQDGHLSIRRSSIESVKMVGYLKRLGVWIDSCTDTRRKVIGSRAAKRWSVQDNHHEYSTCLNNTVSCDVHEECHPCTSRLSLAEELARCINPKLHAYAPMQLAGPLQLSTCMHKGNPPHPRVKHCPPLHVNWEAFS